MQYIRALCWIQHYYYTGVRSWDWYYPYHYAPLISSVASTVNSLATSGHAVSESLLWQTYDKGAPLTPLQQLSLVLPRTSAQHVLPSCYFEAIFGEDSALKRFYPDTFEMDLNFKSLNWEAIALMPEIDVALLVKTLRGQDKALEAEFVPFTVFGHDLLFLADKDCGSGAVQKLCKEWGLTRVAGRSDHDAAAAAVSCVQVDVPNGGDEDGDEQSKTHRKCERTEEGDADDDDDAAAEKGGGGGINGKDVEKVSSVIYKCFMAGKDKPHGSILKYLKKRPKFMKESVDKLRRMFGGKSKQKMKQKFVKQNAHAGAAATKAQVANKVKKLKHQKKQSNNNNNEKKKEKKDFVSRLKLIANQSNQANMTNASELMIDNVIKTMSAQKPQKPAEVDSAVSTVVNDKKKKKKQKKIPAATPTIKTTNFRPGKKVAIQLDEPKHVNVKKIHKRKLKREKLKKMLKAGDSQRIADAPKSIHLPLQTNKPTKTKKRNYVNVRNLKETVKAVSNERNSQVLETEQLLNKRSSNKEKSARKRNRKRDKKTSVASWDDQNLCKNCRLYSCTCTRT
mmetsp:Transcript_15151/g.22941  ORF Transcript_15151/g.22941 Transcript_15151/m.22941 type:complete len:565 (+) Transcript_15151:552-2246(+)